MQAPGLTQEKKKEIIETLEKRGATRECPRCGKNQYTLLDGYFNQTIQHDLKMVALGGAGVPSVILICNRKTRRSLC